MEPSVHHLFPSLTHVTCKQRNMKDLVELGLSANQEKADRLQRVKMEINEMVKERVVAKAKVKIYHCVISMILPLSY